MAERPTSRMEESKADRLVDSRTSTVAWRMGMLIVADVTYIE
jgi:hypothetical protein